MLKMFDFFKEKKVEAEKKELKKPLGRYYIYESCLEHIYYDTEKKTYYRRDINIFNKYQIDVQSSLKPISEEVYKAAISVNFDCNCKTGDGLPEIRKGCEYDMDLLIYENYPEYANIELRTEGLIHKALGRGEYVGVPNGMHEYPEFFEKACMKCKTCLDEKQKALEWIESRIKDIEEEKRKDNLVKEICKNAK